MSRKRPITVTVSGERGSGKTTLISVLSHALESSEHRVVKPEGTPAAYAAIADLHEQFDITFVETGEIANDVSFPVLMTDAELDAEIDKAFHDIRSAAEFQSQLTQARRQQNELRFRTLELSNLVGQHKDSARDRLRRLFGRPASEPTPLIAPLPRQSAEERLLHANEQSMGADEGED